MSHQVALLPRSVSRFVAVQALFQKFSLDVLAEGVLAEFSDYRITCNKEYALFDRDELLRLDYDHFCRLVNGVDANFTELDATILPHLPCGWSLNRLELSTLCMLRCAAFELTSLMDVPTPTIIDEYVKVAHGFLLDRGYIFVNGVLNAAAKAIRPVAQEDQQNDDSPQNES